MKDQGEELAICSHKFFKDIDWKLLEERKVKPPFAPKIVSTRRRYVIIESNLFFIDCAEGKEGCSQLRRRIYQRRSSAYAHQCRSG